MATQTAERELNVERAEMRFGSPLRISGYVFESMPSVIATITESGVSGRGEAAGVYYMGDDQDRMVAAIEEVREQVETGLDREQLQLLLAPCGARNALDCAFWELEARRSQVPVWALAGVPTPKPLVTVFTIPASDPADIRARVAKLGVGKGDQAQARRCRRCR